MTSKTIQVITAKALILVSVLLLAACDGGIFGTGGTDESFNQGPTSAGIATDGLSETNPLPTPNTTDDTGDAGVDATDTDVESDTGTTGGTGGTTGGAVGNPPPSTEPVVEPTDAGTDGDGADADGTAAGDTGTDDEVLNSDLVVSAGDDGTFINATTTALSGPDAQLVVINTSTLTLNIVSSGTEPEAVVFEIAGVAPNTSSESTTLSANQTNLAIVDSNNPTQILVSYSEFIVNSSTLTTLLIREDESGLNAVALVTETQTSDPGLARVRLVQGGTLGDASLESQLQLQSAGVNPGGMDINFEPLSFDRPVSDYVELSAGDYELIDLANRFSPVAVTLSGGSVYTLVLAGNGNDTNGVLTIIDSEVP